MLIWREHSRVLIIQARRVISLRRFVDVYLLSTFSCRRFFFEQFKWGFHSSHVESIEDEDVVVVLGEGDDVPFGGDLESTAPRYLDLGAVEVRDELAVAVEYGDVKLVKKIFQILLKYETEFITNQNHFNLSRRQTMQCSNTSTWLPCESPTKMSPASEMSMPFGYLVTESVLILRRNCPSALTTTTLCPCRKKQMC